MNKTCKLLLLLSLSAVLTLQSCKSTRKNKGNVAERAWKTTLEKASKEKLAYQTLELNGKAVLDIPNMNLSNMGVNYRVSMEQGKRIWIRVTKIIEVARILARPDSLFVLDKINRKYIACDYKLAKEFTGLEMDFELMQDLLLGNFNPIPKDLSPGLKSEGQQIFTGKQAGSEFSYTINNLTNKVTQIQAINLGLKQNTKINYTDFNEQGKTLMPFQTLIEVSSPETLSVELSHRRVNLDPSDLSFSFNVSSGYEKSGCK